MAIGTTASSPTYKPADGLNRSQFIAYEASLFVTALLLLVLTRVLSLAANPDPWLDESMLGINLKMLSYADLFGPLEYHAQSAPLGFLLVNKVIGDIFDYAPVALRLQSVLWSFTASLVLWGVAHRVAGRRAGLLTLILVSLAPSMTHFSIEVKQYMAEAATTAILLAMAVWLSRHAGRLSWRGILGCVAGYGACLLFSNGAPFVLSALGAALVWRAVADPARRHHLRGLMTVGVLCVGVTAVYGFLFMLATVQANTSQFDAFYEGQFLGAPWASLEMALRYFALPDMWAEMVFGTSIQRVLTSPVAAALALPVLAVGLVQAWRSHAYLVVAFALLAACIYGLGIVHILPYNFMRLVLFTFPFVALFIGWGGVAILTRAARWDGWRAVALSQAAVVSMGLTAALVGFAAMALVKTANQEREEVTPLLDHIAEAESQGAIHPVWTYYITRPTIEMLNFPLRSPFIGWGGAIEVGRGPILVPNTSLGSQDEQFVGYRAIFLDETRDLSQFWMLFSHYNAEIRFVEGLLEAARKTGATCAVERTAKRSILYFCERDGASASS